MRPVRSLSLVALASAWLFGACGGGGDSTSPGGNTGGTGGTGGTGNTTAGMTAKIDGQSFTAATSNVLAIEFSKPSGGYIISGFETPSLGVIGNTITLTINNIAAPGTYPLGVDAVSVYGGFAGITTAANATWTTAISGAAGTITITTLTAARIAGTFSFTASPSTSNATGTKSITSGTFDAPIQGGGVVAVLTDSMGGKMSASLNGQSWNAGIVSAGTSLGRISLTGINSTQTVVMNIPLPTAAGTFQLSNAAGNILQAWDPNAVKPAGARCCWGIATDVGTITFTSLTKTRAKGTFSATLSPQAGTAATGQLVITNGTFDLGLFHTP